MKKSGVLVVIPGGPLLDSEIHTEGSLTSVSYYFRAGLKSAHWCKWKTRRERLNVLKELKREKRDEQAE